MRFAWPVVLTALLTLLALLPWPYAYYIFMRAVFTACAIYYIVNLLKYDKYQAALLAGGIAVLYNPVVPVYLYSKLLWFLVNSLTVYAFWRFMDDLARIEIDEAYGEGAFAQFAQWYQARQVRREEDRRKAEEAERARIEKLRSVDAALTTARRKARLMLFLVAAGFTLIGAVVGFFMTMHSDEAFDDFWALVLGHAAVGTAIGVVVASVINAISETGRKVRALREEKKSLGADDDQLGVWGVLGILLIGSFVFSFFSMHMNRDASVQRQEGLPADVQLNGNREASVIRDNAPKGPIQAMPQSTGKPAQVGAVQGQGQVTSGGSTPQPVNVPNRDVEEALEERPRIQSYSVLVSRIQSELMDLGYDPGPADGIYGPKTRTAIRRYQRDMGVTQTGEASFDLLSALESHSDASPLKSAPVAPVREQRSPLSRTTKAFFTEGSSREELRIVQGEPDKVVAADSYREEWVYGLSRVTVSKKSGKVLSWIDNGGLKARRSISDPRHAERVIGEFASSVEALAGEEGCVLDGASHLLSVQGNYQYYKVYCEGKRTLRVSCRNGSCEVSGRGSGG